MTAESIELAWTCYLAGRADRPFSEEYDEALRILDQLVLREISVVQALNLRWHIHFLRGNVEMALDDLSLAIARRPDFGQAYYNRGFVLRHLKEWARSQADYEAALRLAKADGNDDLLDAAEAGLKDLPSQRNAEHTPSSPDDDAGRNI